MQKCVQIIGENHNSHKTKIPISVTPRLKISKTQLLYYQHARSLPVPFFIDNSPQQCFDF